MRRMTMIAATAVIVLAGSTPAQAGLRGDVRSSAKKVHDRAVKALGHEAVGRDIARHGVRGKRGERPATVRELRVWRARLKRMLAPPPVLRTAYAAQAGSQAIVTPSGGGGCGPGYRGLYQFDCATWHSVGCSGDPVNASPAEQRRCAARLQSQRGNQPWPKCGQGGASLEQIAKCESSNDPRAVG